jgi:hypothetical protein
MDQILQGHGLAPTEEKAAAARRKNAEAQKMYRIRKKEHEQSLESEGVYNFVFIERFLMSLVNRLRQMLQESRCDLERTHQDLERTRQELERLRFETTYTVYSPSAPVTISNPWSAQGDMYNNGYAHSVSPPGFPLQGQLRSGAGY